MKLLPEWKDILRSAWSIRFGVLAVIFGTLETLFALLGYVELGIPNGYLSGFGTLFAVLGIAARILDQTKIAQEGGGADGGA